MRLNYTERVPLCRTLIAFLLFSLLSLHMWAQNSSSAKRTIFAGMVLEKATKLPVIGATVNFPKYGIWTVTDRQGMFEAKNIPVGETDIEIRIIGMVAISERIQVKATAATPRSFFMNEDNFGLAEVVVTAKSNKVGAATASSISRSAIDHLQATSLGDIMELLPGQLASNPTLNSPSKAVIRQIQGDSQNSMGTSIVFNGAPMSNNANMQIGNTAKSGSLNTAFTSTAGSGSDMRQISVDNIESVDVIRGIPSVEYGDLTSGVIIINPKAGEFPYQVRMKINPTLTQASIGKGFNLGEKRGKLAVDFDYASSLSDERRPLQGFKRFTSNLLYSNTSDKVTSTTGLGFYTDLDAQKLDPSDAQYQRLRSSENMGFKFNTNVVWNANGSFFKFLRVNVSADYAVQKGYSQERKGNFGYMVTSAMQDGTITSNREEVIRDKNGNAITNSDTRDPHAATNILPYEYLTQSATYGKPLSFFAKATSNFQGEVAGISNRVVAGVEWKTDVNFGRGRVFNPLMPPESGVRMRPFSDIPALNQLSLFVEDNIEYKLWARALKVQLGLRFDMIQPLAKNGHNIPSPRVNASYELIPDILTLRGGYGLTAKAPPLMFLYPDKAYFDFVNYDNIGTTGQSPEQRLSIITTKVYDTANDDLKVARNAKSEIGLDLQLGRQMNFSITGYNEVMTNGYSFGNNLETFHGFNLIKYKEMGERPGTYPLLEEAERTRVVLSYNKPLNDKKSVNRGVEFDLNFGQIKSLRTSFVLNGAWMQSRLTTTDYTFFQKNPENGVYKDIGVYSGGDGSRYDRFSTNLRIIHNIPKISFVVSLSIQTIWTDEHRYLGLENTTPIGYISASSLQYKPLEPGAVIPPDLQKQILTNREITEYYPPLWLFNLRLTKEMKSFGGFAFFVNNLFMHRPMEESRRSPGSYKYRNPQQFFGAEVWLKF